MKKPNRNTGRHSVWHEKHVESRAIRRCRLLLISGLFYSHAHSMETRKGYSVMRSRRVDLKMEGLSHLYTYVCGYWPIVRRKQATFGWPPLTIWKLPSTTVEV